MMALRGKKPTEIAKRLKAMFYGPAGVGKTTAAIQFPTPYMIDTEKGAENSQYVKLLNDSGGAYFPTSDFDDMVTEITSLLTQKHDYCTVIIDPITVVYNDLLDKAEKKVGTEFGKHYGEANKRMRHLLNLLLRLDMNVIITCHAKNEYGAGMTVIGQVFDGYKKLDYLFDLVFEIQKRGKERVGVVKKSRVEAFPESDVFPFSYAEIASRYGAGILERNANPEELATQEQVAEINRLIELLKVSSDVTDKWLDKAMAETWAEMPSATIQTCINHLKAKVAA